VLKHIHPALNGRQVPASAEAPGRPAGKPWSLRDAAAFWGVSERHVAGLAAAKKIKTIRIGHRVFIADQEAQRVAREGTD
jgi:hypothetical protein